MEIATRTRLKVLDTVSVSKLQEGIEQGLLQMGHRSLETMVNGLETMSWKTSMTGHLAQICAMEGLLICLLQICSNGLLPHKMLENALLSCHQSKKFEMSRPANATGPNWQEACIKYLMLRLRMITAKVREIAVDEKERTKVLKKTSVQQRDCLLKLCRIINPGLAGMQTQGNAALPLRDMAEDTSDDEKQIESNFWLLLGPSASSALVPAQSSPAEPSASSALVPAESSPAEPSTSSGFLERANKRALEAALACSPLKPMSKKARLEAVSEAKKKPAAAFKRPAAAPAAAPAAEPAAEPPAEEAAVLREDGILLERYGCSKCRSLLGGCGRCKKFAAIGKNGYIVTSQGHIAQKKQ